MLAITTLLLTAFLFGAMVLYSFGFAAFLFTSLPADQAGALIRKAFPHFYTGCVVLAAAASIAFYFVNNIGGAVALAVIAITAIPARQSLMPAINAATDAGNRRMFNVLHSLSVLLTLGHIGLAAYALTLLLPRV